MSTIGNGAGAVSTLAAVLLAGLGLAEVAMADGETAGVIRVRMERGWSAFRLQEFSLARRRFEGLASELPAPSREYRLALFGLATTLANQRPHPDRAEARDRFEEVVRLDGSGDLAAWSLLALARMEHVVLVEREPDLATVRAAYQRVIDAFPDHPAGEEAFVHLQGTHVATLVPEDARHALATLKAFVARRSGSGFVGAAWALMAECERTLDRPTARLAAELLAVETMELDPSNPWMDRANAYWRIATLAEFEVGDLSVARRFYDRLISEYPTDYRVWPARRALERVRRMARPAQRSGG